ncbi:Positive regulator of phenol hydroxylase [Caballeronia sordidicola]|uniref:Positive regulator of phenol hydroxylase n=2 Tax=Caballeronia sordidicola TaxID=196367 RepID=A0A226WN72_CABSO|nr:Positive regulator of phenol hydroxylase [Caballeronia sordidicola]
MTRFTDLPLKFRADTTINTAEGERSTLPDISDLSARLRFAPHEGQVWLDDQRVVVLNLEALIALRRQLVESVGIETAKKILFNAGHAAGSREAMLAMKLRTGQPNLDAFLVGPQLHALRGEVFVEPEIIDVDVEAGHYYSVLKWRNSAEAETHVASFGGSSEPVCWMQIGYASGYTSALMGRPIAFREVECAASGGAVCRIVGRTVEEWVARGESLDANGGAMPTAPSVATANPALLAEGVVGASSRFLAAWHLVQRVAPLSTTVLLQGETGVGKEVFAKAVHRSSPRSSKRLYCINCAAIPDSLIDSELFGVERGAYTGAVASRSGWFEAADGSTLFLDEIGTLSLTAQAKLLRVLQEGEITRVGSTSTSKVDVRVVCATNVDLAEAVSAGTFRADLRHRLEAFPITIPPLRERRGDIPPLVDLFLRRFIETTGRCVKGLTSAAIDALLLYDFPGNIRELENMVARAAILTTDGETIDAFHLFSRQDSLQKAFLSPENNGSLADARFNRAATDDPDLAAIRKLITGRSLADIERAAIDEALRITSGNVSQAARQLGLTRAQLRHRLETLKDERSP